MLADRAFVRGLIATFCFFLGNISFYSLVTLFMQTAMWLSALDAGFVIVPLTLAFVIAARRASTAQATGISALIKGCAVQASGLASLAVLAACIDAPYTLHRRGLRGVKLVSADSRQSDPVFAVLTDR